MHNLTATSSETDIQSGLACLRDFFLAERILVCLNAPVAGALVSAIGVALRQHIKTTTNRSPAAIDVFGVYIEMTQNIENYFKTNHLTGPDNVATIVISETASGSYQISAGNILKTAHGVALADYIDFLAGMSKQQLKLLYKQQLRQPRIQRPGQGAGLGLIDIARKSSQPLQCGLGAWHGEHSFFAIRATI